MYMNGDNSYYLQTNSTSNFYALNIQGNAVVHAGNIGSQSVSYATSAGNSNTTSQISFTDFKANFPSGAGGGRSFGENHYSMGLDSGNGGWDGPHYRDLIIGYHTGVRIGAHYSGIRFYNNSPTTDANNDGNGDGGEALLMTIGGYVGTANHTDVVVNNNLIANVSLRAPIFYDSNDTSYYLDPNGNSVLTTATFNVNASSTLILTSAGTNASHIKAGAGDELYIGGNNSWQMRFSGANVLMDNGGYLQNNESLRAPIFYDSDDTNYYGNFASTSRFSRLLVQQAGVNSTAGPALRVSKGWDNGTPDIVYDTVVIESNDVTSIRMKESDGATAGWSTGDGYTSFTTNRPMRFFTGGNESGYIYSGQGGTLAMYINNSQQIGMGTSDQLAKLHVVGSTSGQELFAVDGINGRLFTVTDDLSDSLFSVNTIAGLPVIEAFANNIVNIGPYAAPVVFSSTGISTPSQGTSANWYTAFNKRPTGIGFSGSSTKTLTLTLGDGSTLTAAFNDIDTDTDTNTDGQTLSISGSTLTISGGNSITIPSGGISQATADTLYAAISHNHTIDEVSGLVDELAGKQAAGSYAAASHNHDDRYYTESEADSRYILKGTQIASEASWPTATRFGSVGDISQDAGNHALSVRSEQNNDAFMSFHIGGDYAVHFGLDRVSNRMSVGGWSDGAVKYQLWDSRDFSSTNISNWNTAFGWGNHADKLPLAGGTLSGNLITSGSGNYVLIGGAAANNAYNAVASTTGLMFGGANDPDNYSIGTTMQNIGGNYTKLNIKWHTGLRFFSMPQYGGARFYSDAAMNTETFSINNLDGHVRVANNLYVGSTVTATTFSGALSGNATTAGGLAVHGGTNNEANKIVRTDANGYIQAGWINTISGDNGTSALTRIYASDDAYLRFYTPTNFRQVLDVPTRTGGSASGTWGINVTGYSNYVNRVANYTWNNSTLPTGYNSGIETSFVSSAEGWPNYGVVLSVMGRIPTDPGGNFQLYMGHGANYGGLGLRVRSVNQSDNLWTSWKILLDETNYNSYAPTLTGGGASGTWGISISGNAATATNVAWTGVTSRPTALSQFTNDLGNYGGWITSSGSISGNAATATSATQVVTIQDSAPGGAAGKLWWESDTGKLKVYYDSAWIDATPVPDMSLYYAKAGGSIDGDVTIQQTLTVVGNTLIQGTLTETSDISLKENIRPLESSLDKVMKLNGVSFNKKTTPTVKEIGFIAQEVEAVIPELVTETNEGIKTVSYSRVAAVLVETVKEQQAQIDELKEMVNILTKKLNNQ